MSSKVRSLMGLASVVVVMGLFIASGAFQAASASPWANYSNVQVFVQTSKSASNYSYTIAAYDSNGAVVATSQTMYPVASFEVPNGTYTFTAIASQILNSPNVCYGVAQAKDVYGGAADGSGSSTPSNVMKPICGGSPAAEYGFSIQLVTGPNSLIISTGLVDSLPLSTFSIQVKYANGTAAAGSQVSATILGADYWWPNSATASMYSQTGKDGMATLVAPSAPLIVNAWSWLPVNLPNNQTTIQTTVGGEKVNVTVYWQPNYVGLAGRALIMPPATGAQITLHAKQPDYWVQPYGVRSMGVESSAAVGLGTMASAQTGVPASVAPQFGGAIQSPPQLSIQSTTVSTTTSTTTVSASSGLTFGANWVTAGIVVAVALAALSFGVVLTRGRTKSPA